MTENEAINTLKTNSCYECAEGANSPVDCEYGACRVAEATKKAIKSLEEAQQYRAIGTVEEFERLKKPRNTEWGKKVQKRMLEALEELQDYNAIGTPEECREAVEKQTAKKPIHNDRCTCPSCGTYNEVIKKRRNTVVCDTVYCWHCGQAVECRRDIDHV